MPGTAPSQRPSSAIPRSRRRCRVAGTGRIGGPAGNGGPRGEGRSCRFPASDANPGPGGHRGPDGSPGPPGDLRVIACTLRSAGGPSLRSLQEPALSLSKGERRCCVSIRSRGGYTIKPTWRPYFRPSPFAKDAKNGHPCVGDASNIKSPGHPPPSSARVAKGG